MIENRFLHFPTKQSFEYALNQGQVLQTAIAFIDQDGSGNPAIWTHNKYYYCNEEAGTIGNGLITIKQGLENKGSFRVNQENDAIINLNAGVVNSFSGIKVDDTAISANGEETIEIEGDGTVLVSLDTNPDTNNKRLTITGSGGQGGAVDSVNGQTGVVQLSASDVGALPSNTQYVSPSQLNDYQTKLLNQTEYRDIGTSTQVPVITTNSIGQVTSISTTPIDVGQNSMAHKVAGAQLNNFAALDVNGDIIDSGVSRSVIQSLQSQINDIYDQLVGVSATAVPRHGRAVVAGHTAPYIDINISSTDTMDEVTVYRILNPGASQTRYQLYTSSTPATSWSCVDGDNDHTFTVPETTGATLAYEIIATKQSPSAEKKVTVYLDVVEDQITSLSWSGPKSITPSTVEVGNNATITRGEIIAGYLSRDTEDVTQSATFFSTTGRGNVAGVTYTALSAGSDTVGCSYGGITAPETLPVTITSSRLNVQVGSGTSYADATFTNTNRTLSNDMIVSITNNAGDYLFIKVDKRDTVTNLYTYPGPNMPDFEYPIALESPIEDGNYKYYRSSGRYNAATAQFKINRTA